MKHSGTPRSAFSPKVQAQIAAALGEVTPGYVIDSVTKAAPGDGPGFRQQRAPALNKTEAAFLEHLRANERAGAILVQDVTLRLGNGVRYTPDFFLPCAFAETGERRLSVPACAPQAYEVKGFMRDDAAVKLKVAARAFPWIRFYLVSRRGRAHPWRILEVAP